jgi:hypothetical protein
MTITRKHPYGPIDEQRFVAFEKRPRRASTRVSDGKLMA